VLNLTKSFVKESSQFGNKGYRDRTAIVLTIIEIEVEIQIQRKLCFRDSAAYPARFIISLLSAKLLQGPDFNFKVL